MGTLNSRHQEIWDLGFPTGYDESSLQTYYEGLSGKIKDKEQIMKTEFTGKTDYPLDWARICRHKFGR